MVCARVYARIIYTYVNPPFRKKYRSQIADVLAGLERKLSASPCLTGDAVSAADAVVALDVWPLIEAADPAANKMVIAWHRKMLTHPAVADLVKFDVGQNKSNEQRTVTIIILSSTTYTVLRCDKEGELAFRRKSTQEKVRRRRKPQVRRILIKAPNFASSASTGTGRTRRRSGRSWAPSGRLWPSRQIWSSSARRSKCRRRRRTRYQIQPTTSS